MVSISVVIAIHFCLVIAGSQRFLPQQQRSAGGGAPDRRAGVEPGWAGKLERGAKTKVHPSPRSPIGLLGVAVGSLSRS